MALAAIYGQRRMRGGTATTDRFPFIGFNVSGSVYPSCLAEPSQPEHVADCGHKGRSCPGSLLSIVQRSRSCNWLVHR
jgi:hypothetical protein